jgi:hypothetical protein
MNMSMKKISNYTLLVLFACAVAGLWQACSDDTDQTIANPQVKAFTPAAGGPVNTYVKITGNFFGLAKPSVVKFNGVEATVVSTSASNANTLYALVPAGASSGKITVSVDGHEGSTADNFAVTAGTPAPGIISFDPTKGNGADPTTVTITGVNFAPVAIGNVVVFKGSDETALDDKTATVTEASATSLKVIVPVGARGGKISVTASGLTGTSEADFATPAPTVASFTPTYSIVGSTVVITGTNFSKKVTSNVVYFNGVQAAVPDKVEVDEKNEANKLTVIVPLGATTGKISVAVDGVMGVSKDDFTVN